MDGFNWAHVIVVLMYSLSSALFRIIGVKSWMCVVYFGTGTKGGYHF